MAGITYRYNIAFIFIVTSFILTMLLLGGTRITVALVLFSTLVCAVLTMTGELALRISHLKETTALLPMSFVVGFVIVSVPMVGLVLIINISALAAFLITAISLFILSFLIQESTANTKLSGRPDIAVSIIFTVAVGFLAKIPVSSQEIMQSTGILPIWSDYFLHGVTIASLGGMFTSGIDMELAGVSISFYHYAPFVIPAAFQEVSGISGLALSTSVLLPLGLLIAVFGSYAFAVMLGGRLSGLLALTAIICLPAFSVFIQSGWFNFYWLLFATPGTGYALGVSAVACTLTFSYLDQKNNRVLLLAMLLLASIILVRVHLFMLLAPAIISILVLHRWWGKRNLLLGLTTLVLVIGLVLLVSSTRIHTLWLEHAHPYDYLNIGLQWSLAYGQKIILMNYPFISSAIKLILILMAVLGIYFIGFPLALWLNIRRFGFQAKDALPILLVASFVGLMLFAPTAANGDFTEYKHRHFTLLYVMVAIYTITYITSLVPTSINIESINVKTAAYGLVIVIFTTTIILNWNKNPARPNVEAMPWASKLDNQSVIPGLLQASQYMVENASKGDVLATSISSSSTLDVSNLNIQAISLTGIPAFLSRPELKMARSQCVREMVVTRSNVLRSLSDSTSWSVAKVILQQNGIRWFLAFASEKPKWDPELQFSAFSVDGFAVYDSGHIKDKQASKPKC